MTAVVNYADPESDWVAIEGGCASPCDGSTGSGGS